LSRFKGKTVVVTGGASGIGEALVRLVAAEGGRVTIADMDEARGTRLAEEPGTENVSFMRCDVADANQATGVIDATTARFGGVDLLFQ
jgi:NAD(P)-dependent dehydrogenase (short-subunit alcohol dehydrogenase family)